MFFIEESDGDIAGESAHAIEGADELHTFAERLRRYYSCAGMATDLLVNPDFKGGMSILSRPGVSSGDLLRYLSGSNTQVCCMAAAVLAEQGLEDSTGQVLLDRLHWLDSKALHFALEALDQLWSGRPGLASRVLVGCTQAGVDGVVCKALDGFLSRRIHVGDDPFQGNWARDLEEEDLDVLREQSKHFGADLGIRMRRFLKSKPPVAEFALRNLGAGRIWHAEAISAWPPVFRDPALTALVNQAIAHFSTPGAGSLVFVGEDGVGKSSCLRTLGQELAHRGRTFFELSPAQLLAGQCHIGDLEMRLEALQTFLEGSEGAIWYPQDILGLIDAGRHSASRKGAMEILTVPIKEKRIRLVGCLTPSQWERFRREAPEAANQFFSIRVEPRTSDETLALAYEWNDLQSKCPGGRRIGRRLITEAHLLARRFLSDTAFPGATMKTLQGAVVGAGRRKSNSGRRVVVSGVDVLAAVCQETGLPVSILNPRCRVSEAKIRRTISSAVVGQDHVVGAISSCVARMMHGLANNSNKPFGVFLLAGTTGTGKTEMAKATAELLMGSRNKMVRIDMSEMTTSASPARLVGGGDQGEDCLVDIIRKRPYSVVLLDEFEKAHPQIRNMFLQVFDEGRLTDWRGRTVSFRNCLFLLTTNAGADAKKPAGFAVDAAAGTDSAVPAGIQGVFSPELINRFTKVLVFNPLSVAVLGKILDKEMKGIQETPFLRERGAKILLTPTARKWLLGTCRDSEFGARPLVRAVEEEVMGAISRSLSSKRSFPRGGVISIGVVGKGLEVVEIQKQRTLNPGYHPAQV